MSRALIHDVCEARGVPLACHRDDVDAMEGRRPIPEDAALAARVIARFWQGPPHQVDRVLQEGDEVAGFERESLARRGSTAG